METSGSIPSEARNWAMFCHLSALVGWLGNGIGFIVGPLIVWLVKKGDHSFVDDQGKEALNFQITMFILFIVAGLLIFVLIGFILLPILGVINIVLPIIAALRASGGERYRYPFAIRFIS
jgi:uncharacterized Tic20 family protein